LHSVISTEVNWIFLHPSSMYVNTCRNWSTKPNKKVYSVNVILKYNSFVEKS